MAVSKLCGLLARTLVEITNLYFLVVATLWPQSTFGLYSMQGMHSITLLVIKCI